jgi:hypothetical protein
MKHNEEARVAPQISERWRVQRAKKRPLACACSRTSVVVALSASRCRRALGHVGSVAAPLRLVYHEGDTRCDCTIHSSRARRHSITVGAGALLPSAYIMRWCLGKELQNEYINPRLARSEPRTRAAVAVAPPFEERRRAPGNLQKPIQMFVIIQLPPTKRRRSMCQKV